jgi:hypothetical protein
VSASVGRAGGLLAPVIMLQFLTCRVEGAVAKMVSVHAMWVRGCVAACVMLVLVCVSTPLPTRACSVCACNCACACECACGGASSCSKSSEDCWCMPLEANASPGVLCLMCCSSLVCPVAV